MSEYIPKYPSKEGDDSNKTSSELLAETLKPIYVPQDLMLAWETHLASYSRDTHELLDQVKDSETALNTQYQALLTRVQKYEQMLQDITMDSNEFHMDSDQDNFTGWNILAQASYWDYLLKKEITKLSDTIKGVDYRGGLVSEITDEILEGLIADNNYISNVIEALSDTPLIRELADALNTTTTSLTGLREEYVRLAEKQAADAETLAHQQVEKAEQILASTEAALAEQLDRLAEEAAIRTQLLQELEDRANEGAEQAEADMDAIRLRVTNAEDGLTSEVQQRKDGDTSTLNALNIYKVSNDSAITGLSTSLSNNVTKTNANTTLITGLTSRLDTAEDGIENATTAAADAMSKATTAVTANSALSTRVDALAASLTESDGTVVDVNAFNALKAEVNTNKGSITGLVEDVTALESNYTSVNNEVTSQGTAIGTLNTKMSTAENSISQSANDITLLKTDINKVNADLLTKVDSQAFSQLSSDVSELDGKYTTQAGLVTDLRGSLDTTNMNVGNAASAAQNALNTAGSKGKVIFGTSAPAAADRLSQNLWIDTTGGANTPKRWNGSAWVVVTDKVATDALAAANAASILVATKADSSALNTLDSKVTNIDGKVTTHASNITSLQGRVTTVENGLATKANASALNNFYTKTQTDAKATEIAAGQISQYDASLIIGGGNLLRNTQSGGFIAFGTPTFTEVQGEFKTTTLRLVKTAASNQGINQPVHNRISKVRANTEYTLSFYARGNIQFSSFMMASVGTNKSDISVLHLLKSDGYNDTTFVRCTITFTALSNSESVHFRAYNRAGEAGTWFEVAEFMLQEGTKATAWESSYLDTQVALEANASAINTTNTNVSNVNNTVTSQGTRLTSLENTVNHATTGLSTKASTTVLNSLDSKVTAVDGKVTTNASNITTLQGKMTTVENGLTTKADASALNNIYTKTQTDAKALEVAAGQVSAFTATLNGKGTNLADYATSVGEVVALGDWLRVGTDVTTEVGGGYLPTEKAFKLKATSTSTTSYVMLPRITKIDPSTNAQYLLSAYVKSPVARSISCRVAFFNVSDGSYSYSYGQFITVNLEADKWTSISAAATNLTGRNYVTLRVSTNVAGEAVADDNYFLVSRVMYERAYNLTNAPSEWTAGTIGVADKIDATAAATNALTSRVTTTEGSITSQGTAITTLQNTVNNATTGLATKASTSALTATNSEVSRVNGVVTGHTNQLTQLTSDITAINGNLATKADASALNNIYTKQQADDKAQQIAAGQITEFKASLKFGAKNLLKNSGSLKSVQTGGNGTVTDGVFSTISNGTEIYIALDTHEELDVGKYTLSVYVNSDGLSNGITVPYRVGGGTWTHYTYYEPKTSNGWVRLSFPVGVTTKGVLRVALDNYRNTTGTLSFKMPQLERGEFLTDWSPSEVDTQAALEANASAISTTNTEVSRINGVASIAAESTVTLKSRMDGAENALQIQAKVVDGVKASYMVKMETNGVIGGFGLMQSTGALGQVQTSFGVNADSFFIGAPASNKKPFIVTTTNQVVDGITYPAGTYINSAIIANATIGTAKIADLAVTNAKILDATIESAKIKTIKADKIEIGNPLVGPITSSMVTGTYLTNAANLFNGTVAANATFATYGTGTQSDTSGAETNYIQVDVGSTVTMPEVRFFFRGSTGRKTYIKLKASVDGVNWDYIMGSTSKWETIDDMPPGPGGSYSTVVVQAAFSWYGVKPYRYLRIYGNGSNISSTNELVAIIGNASGTITKIGSEGILTGSITADKLSASTIETVALAAQNVTIYKDPSNPTGERMVQSGGLIQIYDGNNRLRVKLGIW